MARGRLDEEAVQELMWQDDEKFEETVTTLSTRDLLDLVTALQNSMAEEQHRFDQLSIELQMYQDTECVDHKRIFAALCTSQIRLARLCTRNMRCFTQQAIKAKELRSIDGHVMDSTENPEGAFQMRATEEKGYEEGHEDAKYQMNGKLEDCDFVVHKADYGEPDIPSPDYNSEEEDYQVHRSEDYVDNTSSYASDPRRYIYYQDEKELEVIPEEDEEFEDIQEMQSPSGSHVKDGIDDESTKISQTECDSGVTDDQRSSAAEECDLEEDECDKLSLGDTDSAKGSLLPDSVSQSPTCSDRLSFRVMADSGHPQSPDVTGTLSSDVRTKFAQENYLIRETHADLNIMNGTNLKVVKDMQCKVQQVEEIQSVQVDTRQVNATEDEEEPDVRRTKNLTSSWDPTNLLNKLYRLEYVQVLPNKSAIYINIEGYLEKLPSGRKKATYWNPWKRRYFQAKDGYLYCFENSQCDKATTKLSLMGGSVDSLENNMLGIDDKKGHYIVVKCGNREDMEEWKRALLSQCAEDVALSYVHPVQFPLKNHRDVIIIDLGSCSTRAGILMDQPTLPQVFFPTVCSVDKISGKETFGMECLLPDIRQKATLSFPVLPSAKITKYTFDVERFPNLLTKVFQELNVNPSQFKVQLCIPRSFSLQTQIIVVKTLLEEFGVQAINLTHQAIASLYAYNATSGIVVDIGDRLDILPIIDGYIVESGVSRLPYGGQRIIHHLRHNLAQKHISLVSDVESFIVRYILEQSCYIAQNYEEEMERFRNDPESVEKCVSVKEFFHDESPWEEITLDYGRFQAPEGLFTPDLWGLDNPGLHKLVHFAIKECSMDIRREMARSIYVSGGVSLLNGFAERLQAEVDKLTPPTVTPKVHTSPYRYHMAYLGACQLAASKEFDQVCVTPQEWKQQGNACLKKWHL
ncbi:uncharacterized protein [Centruroides vittatus]